MFNSPVSPTFNLIFSQFKICFPHPSTSPTSPILPTRLPSCYDFALLVCWHTNTKAKLTNQLHSAMVNLPPFSSFSPSSPLRQLSWRKSSCLSSDCLVCSASSTRASHYQLWLANFTRKLVQITSVESGPKYKMSLKMELLESNVFEFARQSKLVSYFLVSVKSQS